MSAELPPDWYQFTIADWKQQLHEKGFEDADIQFSGFWSQGDGASFTARVNRDFPDHLKQKLLELETTGPVLERLIGEKYRKPEYELIIRIVRSRGGHHVHENTIHADVELRCWDFPSDIEAECTKWYDALEESLTTEARALSREIYKALEAEYDYQQAELAEAA